MMSGTFGPRTPDYEPETPRPPRKRGAKGVSTLGGAGGVVPTFKSLSSNPLNKY